MKIELSNGERVEATYVRHLRTITPGHSMGGRNREIDLYRTEDGTEVIAEDNGDARATPMQIEGMTREAVMFAE